MERKQRYITLPEEWDELTEADWRELLKMRQQMVVKGLKLTIDDVRIESARMLLKNRGVKLQLNNPNYLTLVKLLADSLDWLWKEEEGGLSLVYRSTLNKLPKVRDWLGPLDCGSDMKFGEFRMALAILKNYEQEPSVRDLNVLAGLLYRPEASKKMQHEQQLRRWPYDWDNFDQKEKRGEEMKPWQVWGIYAWFAYFCEALTTETFIIEGEEVTFAPLFQKHEGVAKKDNRGGSMAQICHTLAESHVFGTAKEVDRTPLFDVMRKLLQDYYSLQELKKKKK